MEIENKSRHNKSYRRSYTLKKKHKPNENVRCCVQNKKVQRDRELRYCDHLTLSYISVYKYFT